MSGAARAAIVVVGTEILRDGRPDTNGPHIEEALRREGIPTVLRLVVGDAPEDLAAALRDAAEAGSIVVVSGGLGPTFDDVTREAAAAAFGRLLRRDAALEARLRARYRSRGMTPPEAVFRMADVIDGAEVLDNSVGSAPGLMLAGPPTVILLPGVPAEMTSMLRDEVLPRLRAIFAPQPEERAVFKIAGLFESQVEEAIAPVMRGWTRIGATILASPGDVTLILRAQAGDAGALRAARVDVLDALGVAVYAESDEGIETAVGRILAARALTLATAESCTGGMLGGLITSAPGSSAYYLGGAVAYADRIKAGWLGVPAETLSAHGAVSPETAAAMARGVREMAGSDLALAITGVAGPGGGAPGKPVGRVHIALAAPWGEAARVLDLPGDRATIRIRSCRVALDLLRRNLLAQGEAAGP